MSSHFLTALPQPKLQILRTNNRHDLYFVASDPKVNMVVAAAAATIAMPDVVDGLVLPVILEDSGLLPSLIRRSHIVHYASAVSFTRRLPESSMILGIKTGFVQSGQTY
ncbi:MAG: hypothetical protein ACK4NN_09210 [Rheinheimera sp.]